MRNLECQISCIDTVCLIKSKQKKSLTNKKKTIDDRRCNTFFLQNASIHSSEFDRLLFGYLVQIRFNNFPYFPIEYYQFYFLMSLFRTITHVISNEYLNGMKPIFWSDFRNQSND